MPSHSLTRPAATREVLLSHRTGGILFCSCASIRVKKSVPPSVRAPVGTREDPLVPIDPFVRSVPGRADRCPCSGVLVGGGGSIN